MSLLYEAVAGPLRGLIKLMGWRMIVTGDEHLPAEGPAIIVANHISYLDPVHLGWVIDRRGRIPRFLAKRELFQHRLLGPILRRLRQIPVDRGGNRSTVVPIARKLLREGEWVVVFPEGTISTSFVPADPRPGAARIALATGAPLIPVALWGGQRIHTKGRPRRLQRGVALVARVGPPVAYAEDEPEDAVLDRVWSAVRELVDAAQRTYPQRPSPDEDPWWLPRHLGGTAPSVEEAAEAREREAAERRARRAAEQRARR